MRISDWSSDVCSSDLAAAPAGFLGQNRSSVVRSMPRSIGKAQCLVIIEAVRGRSRVRRQGQFRPRLEIGDRGVAPQPGLLVLARTERPGTGIAFTLDLPVEPRPDTLPDRQSGREGKSRQASGN